MGRAAGFRGSRSRLGAQRRVWLWRGLAASALALTFGYLPYQLYARSGFARYLRLCEDLRTVRAQNARLKADNERLARDAEAFTTDERALERVARAELGWVLPGEVIFDVDPAVSPDQAEPEPVVERRPASRKHPGPRGGP
jgi:cell division protein FtsB